MMLESCSWLAQIQQKKELSKSDGLGPRYKQSCGVGVHVDISTQRQEGVNKIIVLIKINKIIKIIEIMKIIEIIKIFILLYYFYY